LRESLSLSVLSLSPSVRESVFLSTLSLSLSLLVSLGLLV
jgi:hypothetical protein